MPLAFETDDGIGTRATLGLIVLKTDETIELLARLLRDNAGMEVEDDRESRGRLFGVSQRISMREFEKRIQSKRDARGYFWIIGTSLIFESLVLLFACWRFSRRDF